VLAEIVPPRVEADEAFGDVPGEVLFPEEEAVVARAVDKGRREFAAARACARAGLARLGVPPAPILPGVRGAPQWPAGIVGSIGVDGNPPSFGTSGTSGTSGVSGMSSGSLMTWAG